MKRHSTRPVILAASIFATAIAMGADPAPKPAAPASTAPKAAAPAPAATAPAATTPAATAPKTDEVIATVNGEEIKRSEVDAAIGKILAQRGMPPDAIPAAQRDQIVRSMLDDMILDKLVSKESAATVVSDAEVNAEYDKIRQRRGGTDEEINKELASMGMTVESLKKDIKDRMQKRQWVDDQIKGKYQDATEADAKAFYDKNPDQFAQPEQVQASHILFRVEPNANPEDIAAALKKAEQAIERAKKEDFAKLAEELSEDPGSKVRGGDLGFFPRQGAMVEPFAAAAFALKKGEVTKEPVRSDFGYHVIKVTDRKEASKQAFDEMKPQIVEFLGREKKNEAVQSALTALRDKANVKVMLPPPAPALPPVPVTPPAKSAPVEAVTPPVSAPPAPKPAAPKKK